MKKCIFVAVVGLFFSQCAPAHDFGVRVLDDDGKALDDVSVSLGLYGVSRDEMLEGMSDGEGRVELHARNDYGGKLKVSKPGYHPFESKLRGGEGAAVNVVLRAIREPVSLCAKNERIVVRDFSEWIGYDMEAGEMVAPYGEGKVIDFSFKFERTEVGHVSSGEERERSIAASKRRAAKKGVAWDEGEYARFASLWRARVEFAFPNDGEGVVVEETRFLKHSFMTMPHSAPEFGYRAFEPIVGVTGQPNPAREDVGYFLRTRVSKADDGTIEKANFGKVIGDVTINPRGEILFIYYFNPRVNERNLEFDTERNLLEGLGANERVWRP